MKCQVEVEVLFLGHYLDDSFSRCTTDAVFTEIYMCFILRMKGRTCQPMTALTGCHAGSSPGVPVLVKPDFFPPHTSNTL